MTTRRACRGYRPEIFSDNSEDFAAPVRIISVEGV